MKFLIVGLGNPGSEYEDTRHNIGFKVVDTIARNGEASFEVARHGEVSTVRFKGRTLVLLKPSTFMNLSGKAVRYWMDAEKIPLERVLIITDDLALPFGTLRMRAKEAEGAQRPWQHRSHPQHVEVPALALWHWRRLPQGSKSIMCWEMDCRRKRCAHRAARALRKAVQSFASIGLERTMNHFNNT